jgi:hypothetical protein
VLASAAGKALDEISQVRGNIVRVAFELFKRESAGVVKRHA